MDTPHTEQQQPRRPTRLLRRKQLLERGIADSRETLRRKMKKGLFPQAIKIGSGPTAHIAWIEAEIEDWIAARKAQRNGGTQPAGTTVGSDPTAREYEAWLAAARPK